MARQTEPVVVVVMAACSASLTSITIMIIGGILNLGRSRRSPTSTSSKKFKTTHDGGKKKRCGEHADVAARKTILGCHLT